MEFPFDLAACIRAPSERQGPCVGYVDERALRGAAGGQLGAVLEELGQRSAIAQGLRRPVTFGSPSGLGDQRVYLLVDGNVALGFLKVGKKRLFVEGPPAASSRERFADVQGAFREIEPLCALDFYVHERCQRTGHGRQLFDSMLKREQTSPAHLGYDRPSPKLLSFLSRHYGLDQFRPQSNNFVVFDKYFDPHIDEDCAPVPTRKVEARDRHPHPARLNGNSSAAASPRDKIGAAPDHAARRRQNMSSGNLTRGSPDLFGTGPSAVHRPRAAATPASIF
mmetsp:Transcript_38145/g.105082  ORF Transcript_38145/g.105082 Transcript_38145/m.105082 type:complete len:280 (-) Transcript_38145:162-1001(-)